MTPIRATEAAGVDQQSAVIDRLREELDRHAVSSRQRQQFATLLRRLENSLTNAPRYKLGSVHVPILTAHGFTGDPVSGVPIGAVALAMFLGIDILDDVMDGDASPYLSKEGTPKRMLDASTLLFSVVPMLIAELPVDADRSCQLQRRLSQCLMVMSDGQHGDVDAFGGVATPEAARATVDAKSGEMLAAFAEMGAIVADAEQASIAAAGRYGRSLAHARQIGSDIYELMKLSGGSDITNALPTLPVANHLAGLDEPNRAAFLKLFAQAGDSLEARTAMRQELVESDGVFAALVDAELAAATARTAVDDLGFNDLASAGLRELADDTSLLDHMNREEWSSPL